MSIITIIKKSIASVTHPASAIPHDAEGQYQLGYRYATGQGVKQDYVIGYKWLSFAASQGHQRAIEVREALGERMTPQQISDAERLISNRFPLKHEAA